MIYSKESEKKMDFFLKFPENTEQLTNLIYIFVTHMNLV